MASINLSSSITFGRHPDTSAGQSDDWAAFKRWFNRTRGKNALDISNRLLADGFCPRSHGIFVHEESGIQVHIDENNHNNHIDIRLPGESKRRMAYFS